MSWFGVGSADKDCATSQPGNMLLGPGSSAVIYFAFQFPAATEYASSKQTVARCSRRLVNHTYVVSPVISKGDEVRKFGGGRGVQLTDPTAFVVVVM